MKLKLIAPAVLVNSRKLKKVLVPPLGLGMVAALTPPDVEVSLTDENVAAIDFQEETDLVGITVLTITAQRAYEIADIFRSRGVKVVLGGIHASFLPDEAGQHADAVVIGEAEETWPRLIADLKANRLQKRYEQGERLPLHNLPLPRRDLFTKGAYLIKNTLAATRGCPYSCSFCSVSSFFGRTYRCRPVEEVIKELDTFNGGKYFFFVDDNIIGNPKFAKELFRSMIPRKIKWLGQASVTIAKDDELLELAAASGCIGLLIGFESISPANLAAVGKKINVVDEYQTVIRKIHSKGIGIHGFFIIGLDEDTQDVFERTVRFAQKMKLESAGFAYPMPLPGTDFYNSLDKEGRIITREWSRYADEIVFEPKLMSRQVLKKGHDWASQEFFKLPSIWERVGLARRNLALLWAINIGWRAHYSRLR
ncbi:MAG: radical SAM protein [Dehalococcoidales bacterium]|nr:radical SAM protein [Dehalococcoidales bacterium]